MRHIGGQSFSKVRIRALMKMPLIKTLCSCVGIVVVNPLNEVRKASASYFSGWLKKLGLHTRLLDQVKDCVFKQTMPYDNQVIISFKCFWEP